MVTHDRGIASQLPRTVALEQINQASATGSPDVEDEMTLLGRGVSS
jgi:hypothetical protein